MCLEKRLDSSLQLAIQGPFPYHFPIFQVTFPIFQDKNQCQNICRAFRAQIKALVLSDFSDFFQLSKIYFPIIQVSQYDFAPGSCNRPPIHASWNPELIVQATFRLYIHSQAYRSYFMHLELICLMTNINLF